jgi:hypothetical protein
MRATLLSSASTAIRTLHLSSDLDIPIDFVTRRVAALGMSGAGKSNAFAVMIEQTQKCGGVFNAFDPLGTLWGLRAAADGVGPGLPIPIFGGHHADVEISASRGALLARELYEANVSALIDLSAFEGDERCTFVADFAREKMKLHARRKKPLAFFVDEVHLLAPETSQSKAENRCEIALADIHTGGRGVGIGLKTATQSAAEQSKRTLKQAELVIAMRTFSPLDQKQIKAYLGSATTPDRAREVLASLARLRDGEAWFISPHWLGMIEQHRFALRETFDSSRAPEVGETIAEPKQFAAVDLERLRDAMAADDVESESESPDIATATPDIVAKLRARVSELEAHSCDVVTIETKVPIVDVVELRKLADAFTSARDAVMPPLTHLVAELDKEFSVATRRVNDVFNEIFEKMNRVRVDVSPVAPAEGAAPKTTAKTQNRTVRAERVARASSAAVALSTLPRSLNLPGVSGGGAKILDALAALHPTPASRTQVSVMAGYSASGGGFRNYLGSLRTGGLIHYPGNDLVALTDAGVEMMRDAIAAAPRTSAAIVSMWMSKLKSESRVLHELVGAYPKTVTRSDLASWLGMSTTGGGFRNYLGKLRSLGLIEYTSDGGVRAVDALFPNSKGKR